MASDPKQNSDGSSNAGGYVRPLMAVVAMLFACAVLACGGLTWAGQHWRPYVVPSTSMEPTIVEGETVLIDLSRRSPARGDVVVYREPGGEAFYVKRVIAIGGDTVGMRRGAIFLNGQPLARNAGEPTEKHLSYREQSGSHSYTIWEDRSYGHSPFRDVDELKIPQDAVWLVGDNRDNSMDSRRQGPVLLMNIVGTATSVYEGSPWFLSDSRELQ